MQSKTSKPLTSAFQATGAKVHISVVVVGDNVGTQLVSPTDWNREVPRSVLFLSILANEVVPLVKRILGVMLVPMHSIEHVIIKTLA